MSSLTVLIKEGLYPFGQNLEMEHVRVEEVQRFGSLDSLKEKKSEMLRKAEMLNNPYIIQLKAVNQENVFLKYQWEYVPHNFQSYIRTKFTTSSKPIWKMTKNLLLKKMSFELTMLMSYLSKMKIQTDFSMKNIGITNDQKLKFYLNPKNRMGIRSQLSLIAIYGQSKQKILKQFQASLEQIQNQQQNDQKYDQKYDFKSNRNYYQDKMHNDSFAESISSSSFINDRNNKLKQPKIITESRMPKRKMSFNHFDVGHNSDIRANNERTNSSQKHKYSFQYNMPKEQPNKPFKKNFKEYKEDDTQSLNHSKSIKIELQQKQTLDNRKKRKDSYKVRITTYHEYQLDHCPPEFFKNGNNDEDIFQHFAKRAQREQEEKKEQEEREEREEGYGNQARYREHQEKESNQYQTEAPSPIYSTGSNISQRIRMARQRSEQALNKIKFMKK